MKNISPYIFAGLEVERVGKNPNIETPYEIIQRGLLIKRQGFIQEVITNFTGVSFEQIQGKQRYKHIREARQLFHYFMRKYTSGSLQYIGSVTKNDHATVINSCKAVEADKDFVESVKFNFKKIDTYLQDAFKN